MLNDLVKITHAFPYELGFLAGFLALGAIYFVARRRQSA